MASTRGASRTTSTSKTSGFNPHHTNGSATSYDINDSAANLTYPPGNSSEFDPNLQRSSLMKNVSQYDGIYRNARFIHAISSGLLGQQVVIQTSDHERFHGVLETLSPNADISLTVSHRLDNNNNDIITSSTLPIDLIDTSAQTFELHKRIIKASNIVEIIAVDVDLSGNAKCSLDENPKASHHEQDRFSRMEHFYGSDEIDPDTLEDLGDDGKTGFDAEDMFDTNREKFNAKTDFDESKYTNVPVRQLSAADLLEIEKKVQEIERGTRTEDIDEDDAGVKRPSESHNLDEGNSNSKSNRTNRNDFIYDTEYNSSKRNNWPEQRSTGGQNNNRRGGGNNPKQNQYPSSNSRQQYNTRIARNNRFPDNRSPHEGRDSPMHHPNDESNRNQRLNSGNFSQDQTSGPSSPSTAIPARTIYPSAHRSTGNRNSPAPYTGSSSSRTNSISTVSPPTNQQTGNNKLPKKSSLNDQQSINDESDQPKQQRSSNNQSNASALNRPSQLQSRQQPPLTNVNLSTSSNLPNQDDNSSSHDTINTNQSQTTGTTTPNSMKLNAGLNPEADEFVPVLPRETSSRPESRDASTAGPIPMNAFIQHPHPQALHLIQQQQHQSQQQIPSQPTPPIIAATHPQNAAALYQQYYQTQFVGMPQFISAAPQQMTVGVMGAPMVPSQPLIGTGPNTNSSNNGSSSGMTTPNSSVSGGPTYKVNNTNQTSSADNSNNGGNNAVPKKAVVSVQRSEQPNISQQQPHMPGAPQMILPAAPIRYYSPEYLAQQASSQSMQFQHIPFYYQMNSAGLIQATTAAGQSQNIMLAPASSQAGPTSAGLSQVHYTNLYDPRMYSIYSSAAINPNWQLPRSPPQQQQQQQQSTEQQSQQQQQQQQQQQRGYGNGQNVTTQQGSSVGGSNMGGRPSSVSGQPNTGPPVAPQYTINGPMSAAYAYGVPASWISGPQQIAQSQGNLPPQMNPAFNVAFDPSQQGAAQAPSYAHSNSYEASAYYPQTTQQQASSQQNLDQVPQGSFNR